MMVSWALWILLSAAIVIMSLAGYLSLGIFQEVRSICPDAFRCEDAKVASILFLAVTVAAAAITALAWWALGSKSKVARDK